MLGTILTIGGGGFSEHDVITPIDDYLLERAGKDRPRVCFVPTASGDADAYSERFEKTFSDRAETSVLSLFCHPRWGYRDPSTLLEQDIVYVGGGSTANLLAVWRLHGLPDILERAMVSGVVLAGISAGMNCWFEGSSTDSFGPYKALPDGLGFLPGSACPHYFGEAERQPSYRHMIASGELSDGHAVDDGVALLWRNGEVVDAVSEKPGGQAFRVSRDGDLAVEEPIPVRYLG